MVVAGDLTPWLRPEALSLGRLPIGSVGPPLGSVAAARHDDASPWVRSLAGTWRFRLAERPDDVADLHLSGPTDGPAWSDLAVPGTWVLQGHGAPAYLNIEMPFELQPPEVPTANPTGVHRTTFRLPAAWLRERRRTLLRLGSADSCGFVWCNGTFVGFGKDSRLPSTFDLTDHLRAGANDLAVVVPQWSDASWIEDQDQWWLPGLHRDVELWSVPATWLADAAVVPDLDLVTGEGVLRVDATVAGAPDGGEGLTVEVDVLDGRGRRVGGLAATDVPAFEHGHAAIGAYLWPGPRVRAEVRVPAVRPWSHEDPHRYRAVVVLRHHGEVVDVRAHSIGFRHVEVADRQLRINGVAVVIAGVNRHEQHPDTGRTVDRDHVRRDLELMKRHHLNAVRTSHYPDGEDLYELCDELGLYVVDEANVESHGRWARLAEDPAYLPAFVDRAVRMVARDRSHACVIAWSLGNEAGDGPALDAAAAAVRRLDPTRPVQYEGPFFHGLGVDAPVTDIVCPMYAPVEALDAWAAAGTDPRRPLILCEYGHAMGQAGGLDEYWARFGRPGLQGGFVWEWADHGLRRHEPDGSTWLAYGGDFGEPRHDGTFVCDGLVSPDREPHPLLAELAALAAPIRLRVDVHGDGDGDWDGEGDGDGRVVLEHRMAWTGLGAFTARWELVVDGAVTARGRLDLPDLAPGTTGPLVDGPPPWPALPPGATAHLTVTFRHRRRRPWPADDRIAAVAQVELAGSAAPGPLPPPVLRRPHKTSQQPTVAVDEAGLAIGSLRLGWPEACLWRAPTDNDDPPGAWRYGPTTAGRWRAAGLDALAVVDETTRRRSGALIRLVELAGGDGATVVRHRRTVRPDGDALRIDEDLDIAADVPDLPRVGIRFDLPGHHDRLRWCGLGPGDSYPDRRAAAVVGTWEASVAATPMPFMVPQETGLRLATRWAVLEPTAGGDHDGGAGPAVGLWGDRPLGLSALPWSVEALTAADHAHLLAPDGRVHVHLDVAHRGLGTAACGPDTADRHRPRPARHRWTWWLAPR